MAHYSVSPKLEIVRPPAPFLLRLVALAIASLLAGCFENPDHRNRSPQELRNEVRHALKVKNAAAAEEALSRLIEINPNDFDAAVGRATLRLLGGNPAGAQADINAAVRIDAAKGERFRFFICDRAVWRAREHDMNGRYDQALKIYDVVLSYYPKSGMAYHDRGAVKTSLKDYAGAIDDLTKAIEYDEGNNSAGDSYVLRARAKRAKGDEAGAGEDEVRAKNVLNSRMLKQ